MKVLGLFSLLVVLYLFLVAPNIVITAGNGNNFIICNKFSGEPYPAGGHRPDSGSNVLPKNCTQIPRSLAIFFMNMRLAVPSHVTY